MGPRPEEKEIFGEMFTLVDFEVSRELGKLSPLPLLSILQTVYWRFFSIELRMFYVVNFPALDYYSRSPTTSVFYVEYLVHEKNLVLEREGIPLKNC